MGNIIMTIWIIISLTVMPFVYIVLSIRITKAFKNANNADKQVDFNKLYNALRKTYGKLEEQEITLNYMCQLLENIDKTQGYIDTQNITLDAIYQQFKDIENKQDSSVTQEQINNIIENIKLQQNNNNSRDYVQLFNLVASIKAENKNIFNIIAKEKVLKNQLHDALYQNEVLLDDIDILERKYEKQRHDFNGLLEAAKILCEYYEDNKDINKALSSNNTAKKEIITVKEKETEQDEAMKRLNELIKKLYKIKEEQ